MSDIPCDECWPVCPQRNADSNGFEALLNAAMAAGLGNQNIPTNSIIPTTPRPEDVECYVEIPAVRSAYQLDGLVVRHPPRKRKTRDRIRFPRGAFSRSSHISVLSIGTLVTLPGAWRYMISTGTGWPSVSIPRLCEIASLICSLFQYGSTYNAVVVVVVFLCFVFKQICL